ncbi:MAG: DUF1974 domain-containing protein, partial [Magnetococcales bacterium]|nr:DUF1974 domain-containing protein [Magnetococcales bacterium]
EARVGQGWGMLMECLAEGRSISLPALSTGGAKLAARHTGAYARVRRQFKLPIGRFEGVQEALARIAGQTYIMEAARMLTAAAVDRGERPSVISALVKRELTERMRSVINDAMDVVGGAGICMGSRNPLGRIYKAIPIGITVEGANILTRSMIVFGQGAIRAHPYLLKEMNGISNPDPEEGLRHFDRALFAHIRFTISNVIRTFWLGISAARFQVVPLGLSDARYFRSLTRMSAAFALCADLTLAILGGGLKRKEFLSGRFADVLSHLYMGSALLKQFYDHGRPKEDLPLLDWGMRYSLYQSQQALLEILQNFPIRWLGSFLKVWIFPYGAPHQAPNDRLTQAAAETILSPSETRDRLTQGIYLPVDHGDPMALLEEALKLVVTAEGPEKKLKNALSQGVIHGPVGGPFWDETLLQHAVDKNVISGNEANVVRRSDQARSNAILVDSFDKPDADNEREAT